MLFCCFFFWDDLRILTNVFCSLEWFKILINSTQGEQLAGQLWKCLGVEIADHIENKFGYRQFAGSKSICDILRYTDIYWEQVWGIFV